MTATFGADFYQFSNAADISNKPFINFRLSATCVVTGLGRMEEE